jgi:hypothetical protein
VEQPRYATYEAFWPFYVSQHRNPMNRRLHFIGTTLVLASLSAGVLVSPRWAFLAPFAGYGFAWVGHLAFERNRPATFTYPFWSLRADFRMFRRMLAGSMDRELERFGGFDTPAPGDSPKSPETVTR